MFINLVFKGKYNKSNFLFKETVHLSVCFFVCLFVGLSVEAIGHLVGVCSFFLLSGFQRLNSGHKAKLSMLFGFHGFCKLLMEGQMCQGHVIQDEPKCCCSLCEVTAHLPGDQHSLAD